MSEKNAPLIWVDLEMTGLEPERDAIIEFAAVITDDQLKVVAEFEDCALFQPESRFQMMDEWNRKHHSNSGLWSKVCASSLTVPELETKLIQWASQFTEARTSPLCGNSIWQDRRFISRYMPKFDQFLHYRMIDVSTIKVLAQRWYPKQKYDKKAQHRAKDDILESIDELRYYRSELFKSDTKASQ
jgi:oligoribonuclease